MANNTASHNNLLAQASMPFNKLPPELICQILLYLPLQDLNAFRRTSHTWTQFFFDHENSIYCRSAVQHDFASSVHTPLEEVLREKESRYLNGVHSWRVLCERRFMLESNWAKFGRYPLTLIAKDHPDVHRIKIDEDVGIVITTHADGGLVVRDLDSGEVLWGLPRTYVRSYAHCEYGNGFLVFDRLGQAKEIWKLASEYDNSPLPADEFQEAISFTVNQYIPKSKGSFKPWALLTMPEFSRAFRLVYPTLLVAGLDKAYLYNVESGHLTQTVENTQIPRDGSILGNINYVELSPLHVLICGRSQLRFFERGSGSLLYQLPARLSSLVTARVAVDDHKTPQNIQPDHAIIVPVPLRRLQDEPRQRDSEFIAVHTSSDGKTVVALTSDSRLIVIKDILGVIKGELTLQQSSVEIFLEQSKYASATVPIPGIYLAFEYGHAGVITASGIYLITLDPSIHGLVDPWLETQRRMTHVTSPALHDSAYPFLRVCRVYPFDHKPYFEHVSCLQMTRTRMSFTWNPHIVAPNLAANPADVQAEREAQVEGKQEHVHVETDEEHGHQPIPVTLDTDDVEFLEENDHNIENDGTEEDDDDDDGEEGFVMNEAVAEHWTDDHDETTKKAVVCVNFAPAVIHV